MARPRDLQDERFVAGSAHYVEPEEKIQALLPPATSEEPDDSQTQ